MAYSDFRVRLTTRLSVVLSIAHFVSLPMETASTSFQNACDNGNPHSFNLVYWEHKPYIFKAEQTAERNSPIDGVLPEILRSILKACCKTGANLSFEKPIEFPVSLRHAIMFNNQTLDIILPVGRRIGRTESIFLRPFLGLIDSPGVAVVVKKSISGAEILAAILDSWPILVFIATCVSLSGIVIWVLDYRSNGDEFPAFFPHGIFEGFWWAAVTMTTVGYGDKVPRSVCGRLFAVVWINVGLVILAIFMGIITTSLTSTSLEQVNNLYGMPVSVINGSAEQQLAILQNAQLHVKTTYDEVYKSVGSGESRMAIVDIYSTTQHSEYYKRYTLYVATVLSEPVVYGAVLPMGAMETRECFLNYRDNHQQEMHETVAKFIRTDKTDDVESSFGAEYFDGSMFGYTVYAMVGVFAVALAVGLFWQYYHVPRKESTVPKGIEQVQQESKVEATSTDTPETGEDPLTCNDQRRVGPQGSELTERLMAAQSTEVLALEDEFKAFRKNWEKSFRALQERHRKEQERLFGLENFGYDL